MSNQPHQRADRAIAIIAHESQPFETPSEQSFDLFQLLAKNISASESKNNPNKQAKFSF
jgi:hypothetical protein